MKRYKAAICLAVGLSEDQVYHELTFEAENAESVFNQITNKEWFHYTRKGKLDGQEYEMAFSIRVKYISDISIRELVGDKE